jgi:hypothetical protein
MTQESFFSFFTFFTMKRFSFFWLQLRASCQSSNITRLLIALGGMSLCTALCLTGGMMGSSAGMSVYAQASPPPPLDTARIVITITGENFLRQSTVFVGTTEFTPEYVSPGELRVRILRSLLAQAQTNNIRVVNPPASGGSAGGGSSETMPLVTTCKAQNPVFADVRMTIRNFSFHMLDSSKTDGATLTEAQRRELSIMNIPYEKTTSISGKIFNDGNAEIRFEQLSTSEPSDISGSKRMKYFILKTATDSMSFYDANNALIVAVPVANKPYKRIADKVKYLSTIFAPGSGALQTTKSPTSAATASIIGPPDPVIRNNAMLYEAWVMGFNPQKIGASPRYRIMFDHDFFVPEDPHAWVSSIKLAAGEHMECIFNSATNVIEEIRTYRGTTTPKPLVHRVIQRYTFDSNKRLKWQSSVSYSYYTLNGLPMVFGSADLFDEYVFTPVE